MGLVGVVDNILSEHVYYFSFSFSICFIRGSFSFLLIFCLSSIFISFVFVDVQLFYYGLEVVGLHQIWPTSKVACKIVHN